MPAYFGCAGQYLDRVYPDTRTSGIYDVPACPCRSRDRMDAAGITDMGRFQTSHECSYLQIAGNGDPYFYPFGRTGGDHAGRYRRQKDRSYTGCREISGGSPLHDGWFDSGCIFRFICRTDYRERFSLYQSCYFPGRSSSGNADGKESGLSSGHQ